MLGATFPEWILIRLCILFFRYTPLIYIAALLGLFLGYGQDARQLVSTNVFCGLLIAEALYFCLLYRPHLRYLSNKAAQPDLVSPADRRALLNRVLSTITSIEEYMRWWFLGSPLEDIRRDNLQEFLLWAFFDRDEASVIHEEKESIENELDEYITAIEERLGRTLGPGRGPAKSFRLTFDPVDTAYRGLAWYAVMFLVDQATHVLLVWYGFKFYARPPATSLATFPPRPQEIFASRQSPVHGLSYWYRPHKAPGSVPIVFYHGIGVGLWTYADFLGQLVTARAQGQGDIGMICVELIPISFRLAPAPLSKAELMDQMTSILDHHNWNKFTVASHSYGSVLTTHMLRNPTLKSRISSVVLIDPVTLMLHMPDVAYNFTRRKPKRANEWQLWYFASTDPGVAYCLGRHFLWQDNILWKEELLSLTDTNRQQDLPGLPKGSKAAVCLAGRDLIVNTATVKEYLVPQQGKRPEGVASNSDTYEIEVIFFPKLDHAQVFDNPPDCKQVVQLIKSYCRT